MAITQQLRDPLGESKALYNLGNTLMVLEQYSSAVECLQISLDICREFGNFDTEFCNLTSLATIYSKLKRSDLALEYCNRALSIATELGIPLAKECQELKEELLNEQT